MQLFLDCLPCLCRQALEAARLVTDDEDTQARILDDALCTLAQHGNYPSAPRLAQDIHALIKRNTGRDDPYGEIKIRDVDAALRLEPLLARFVGSGPHSLFRALKVSATGNLMDAALYVDLDIEACIEAELERPFAHCDLELLNAELSNPGTVLIVGDNAGEAVFDKLLIRQLAQRHEVVFAVRAEPIINDVTVTDAQRAGVATIARIVSTGCGAPGLILDSSSDEFRALFEGADVVISKGQGNFEALSDSPRPVYFLLKAKCAKVADALGVQVGDYVLKKSGEF